MTAEADQVADLADRFWQEHLVADPVTATIHGDRRYDDRLDDPTPEGRAARLASLRATRRDVEALDARALDAETRITRDALLTELDGEAAAIEADLGAWTLDPLDGPQITAIILESLQPLGTAADMAAMVARWRALGPWFEVHAANLRRAVGEGRIAVETPARKVLDQLDRLLAQPLDEWPLLAPLRRDDVIGTPGAWAAFGGDLRSAVRDVVVPAIAAYAATVRDVVVPVARPDDQPGLAFVPGGPEAYRDLIRRHTSLSLSAEEIHAIGLEEVARIDAEIAELGDRILGTAGLAATRERLRRDPALHFSTSAEVFEVAERSLARAEAAIDAWFGILPQARCTVIEMSALEAPHSTIAYYREPAADGSRPGSYVINTHAPETRPRYEAEALAFHEAIPGHHLQIAIAQELAALPAFRRHLGPTAYVEGWGLYTERLCDEMGLYSGDLDRIGIRSYDAWRACRLVVDTGIHALGWTRQAAIDYMIEHTALAENNIVNEVDRYIVMPGQALAYKLGQREILRLRAQAESALGPRFDIRAFHDQVLGHGALGLEPLGGVVREWMAAIR